ncbi:MAG TPA: hypothetical protein VFE60_27760 [Roseiarcus sp.]|nr:hypothetical protein [Roseiarcus sp.]
MSGEKGVEKLPPWLAARYRSKRHLAALVKIDRVLRDVGMTWATLHRVTADPGDATESVELEAVELEAMVEKLERVKPWDVTSSAPHFVTTLRGLASGGERVSLSSRQASWLELLLSRADQMLERPTTPPTEAYTGNVVQLRPRGQAQ